MHVSGVIMHRTGLGGLRGWAQFQRASVYGVGLASRQTGDLGAAPNAAVVAVRAGVDPGMDQDSRGTWTRHGQEELQGASGRLSGQGVTS